MLARLLNFPLRALPKWWKRWHTIFLIVLLSSLIHAWAVWQLPLDADEPVYMRAGREYAQLIREGDWRGIIQYEQNQEHPPLIKLMYSLPFLLKGESVNPDFEFYFNRSVNAFFGILQVFILALFDPLAAFLLTFHSYTIKYTSQVYLESFPLFASLLAVLLFRRYFEGEAKRENPLPLWISAGAMGAAIAGKYPYAMMLVPIAFLIGQFRRKVVWRELMVWGGIVAVTFMVLNPYLWNEPFRKIVEIFAFHRQYTHGGDVLRAAYPWWQPVIWVATALPWHPRVFFFLTLDEFIFWAGAVGLYFYGRKEPWLTGWFVVQFAILLVYPTKWPQYSLIVIPALCMSGSGLLRSAYAWILEKDQYWDYLEEMLPKPPKVFWWLIIGFTGLIVIGKVTYEYDQALLRRGWQHLMVQTAPLPSNTIYDLHLRSNGDMMIATAQGAALWHVSEGSPWGENSLVYNRQNSGIGDDRVRAVYEDRQGNLWFGTESGLSCLCKGEWKQIPEAGLSEQVGKVRSFVEDTKDNLWIGTLNGLFMWDGSQLMSYSRAVNPLPDLYIFAIAHQIVHDEEYLWLGTQKGVTRLKLSAQTMDSWDFSSRDLGWGGVSHLIVDTQNRVWITTIGGGIGRWDDKEWTFYRLGSSNLPTSVVNSIIEQPGKGFWLGHGFPTEPGGLVSKFDGVDEWTIYRQNNSGFNGGEPMAFAFDPIGRLWIGTAIDGLQIYDPALAKR